VPTERFTDVLGRYRSRVNPEARSIIVAMTSNGFTLNDPRDPRGLDIAGFDSAAPAVMSDFISGAI
jgi:60 kDa SS-A/Ro ribonucleoprotein